MSGANSGSAALENNPQNARGSPPLNADRQERVAIQKTETDAPKARCDVLAGIYSDIVRRLIANTENIRFGNAAVTLRLHEGRVVDVTFGITRNVREGAA
jgi:hypothetical protein